MKSKYDNSAKNRFSFPAALTPDLDDGGYVVTFRDLPEAITQGDSIEVALQEASDCLEEAMPTASFAIAARIDERLDIPEPSDMLESEYLVTVPMQTALKAAVTLAMSESKMNKVQLANALKIDEKEVRRILNPRHGTKLATLERTLPKKAVSYQLSAFSSKDYPSKRLTAFKRAKLCFASRRRQVRIVWGCPRRLCRTRRSAHTRCGFFAPTKASLWWSSIRPGPLALSNWLIAKS